MIKFFRKIRQNLLAENNFKKYLLYALGEIILVVIGILIALQINNQNELHKKDTLRVELLENLKLDLENDLKRLAVTNRFLKDRKNYSSMLLELFSTPPKEIDSIQVILAIERTGYAHTFNPPMPTYNEMKGAGILNLLQSQELKKALATYETFVYNNREIEQRYANSMTEFSNLAMRYMDPQFGYIDINNSTASVYKGLSFDLNAMAKDNDLITFTKIVLNRSIVEQRYKEDLIKPRIQRTISIIDSQLMNNNTHD